MDLCGVRDTVHCHWLSYSELHALVCVTGYTSVSCCTDTLPLDKCEQVTAGSLHYADSILREYVWPGMAAGTCRCHYHVMPVRAKWCNCAAGCKLFATLVFKAQCGQLQRPNMTPPAHTLPR